MPHEHCLKLDDFQENDNSLFESLREDKDFILAGDQVVAHKVTLACRNLRVLSIAQELRLKGLKKPNFEQNVLQSSEPTKSKPNKPKTMITLKNETIAFNWTS